LYQPILYRTSTDSGTSFGNIVKLSNPPQYQPLVEDLEITPSGTNTYVLWTSGDVFFSTVQLTSAATVSGVTKEIMSKPVAKIQSCTNLTETIAPTDIQVYGPSISSPTPSTSSGPRSSS